MTNTIPTHDEREKDARTKEYGLRWSVGIREPHEVDFEAGWLEAEAHNKAVLVAERQAREDAEQKLETAREYIKDAERMYATLDEMLRPFKSPVESITQPTAIVPRLIERMKDAERERDSARYERDRLIPLAADCDRYKTALERIFDDY